MSRELRHDIDLVAIRLKRMGLPYVAKQFAKQPFATGTSWKPLIEDQLFMGNTDRRGMNNALKILWDWTMTAKDQGHQLKPVRFNTAASRVAARHLHGEHTMPKTIHGEHTMPKTITTTDRKTLVRLASSMEKGTDARRAILLGLKKTAMSKLVREWERLLEQLIEEGDQLGQAARGFGARMAADMPVAEAQEVVDGYADNYAKLERYTSTLSRAVKGAPDEDKDALNALLRQGHNRKWIMQSAEAQARQALAQYEKETTSGKLRTGFKRLVQFAESQWPMWKSFTVTGGKPVYVKDSKGGYGKATLTIKGLDLSGKDTEIDLAYRAWTGEMWGSLNGKEVFRKVGGKWPLKTMLKDVSRKYPALSGNCDVSTYYIPNVEKMVKNWLKAKHPNVDLQVVTDNTEKKWEFWLDGEKVGWARVTGYNGWGNIGYYDIGGKSYEYDKWNSSQCPPSIDTKKFWSRLIKFLSDLIEDN